MKSSDVAAPVTIYVPSNTAIDLIREEEKNSSNYLVQKYYLIVFPIRLSPPLHSIRDMLKGQQIMIASLV